MSANKEAVISEKELSCKFGQEVLVGYSEAMHPSSYPTFDGFVAAVQKEWDIQWSRVYSADWSSELPSYNVPDRQPCCRTPPHTLLAGQPWL